MTVTASAPPQSDPQPRKAPRKRVVLGTLLVGVGCLGAVFYGDDARAWYKNATTGDEVGGVYYPSAKFMAQQVDCLDTFRPARMPGGSTSSGECDLADGTHIEFRIFGTGAEASAWLDGSTGQSRLLEESGAGGAGGNWAIRITGTTDREAINAIFRALPDSRPT